MTFFRNRHSKGIPTGGQFAATIRSEPTIKLTAPTPGGLGHQDTSDMRRSALGMFRDAVESHRDRAEARQRSPRPQRNPAATRVAVAALVLATALTVTSCGSTYSGNAVVDGKNHESSHSKVTMMPVGKTMVPRGVKVPEKWELNVHGPDGKTFEVEVNQGQFDSVQPGATVRIEQGKLAP